MIWLLLACRRAPPEMCAPEHPVQLAELKPWLPVPEGPVVWVDQAGAVTRDDGFDAATLAVDKRARVAMVPVENAALALCTPGDGDPHALHMQPALVGQALDLSLHLRPGSVRIEGLPELMVEDLALQGIALETPCCSAAELATLSRTLGRIKDEYPDVDQLQVHASGDVVWDALIQTLGAARQDPRAIGSDGKPRELFPYAVWIPPAPTRK